MDASLKTKKLKQITIFARVPEEIGTLARDDAKRNCKSFDGIITVALRPFFALKRGERERCYRKLPPKFGRPLK